MKRATVVVRLSDIESLVRGVGGIPGDVRLLAQISTNGTSEQHVGCFLAESESFEDLLDGDVQPFFWFDPRLTEGRGV